MMTAVVLRMRMMKMTEDVDNDDDNDDGGGNDDGGHVRGDVHDENK